MTGFDAETRRRAQTAAAKIVADLKQRNTEWSEETGEPSTVSDLEYEIAQQQVEEALMRASAKPPVAPLERKRIVPPRIVSLRKHVIGTGACPLCGCQPGQEQAEIALEKLERLYKLLDEWVEAVAWDEHVPGWVPDLARETQDVLNEGETS